MFCFKSIICVRTESIYQLKEICQLTIIIFLVIFKQLNIKQGNFVFTTCHCIWKAVKSRLSFTSSNKVLSPSFVIFSYHQYPNCPSLKCFDLLWILKKLCKKKKKIWIIDFHIVTPESIDYVRKYKLTCS